jgi:hypothetical protein
LICAIVDCEADGMFDPPLHPLAISPTATMPAADRAIFVRIIEAFSPIQNESGLRPWSRRRMKKL